MNEFQFKSPQTGSTYVVVVTNDNLFVAVRYLGDEGFRISIRGQKPVLQQIRNELSQMWSDIKDGDHISVVVEQKYLLPFVCEAIVAVDKQVSLKVNADWQDMLSS